MNITFIYRDLKHRIFECIVRKYSNLSIITVNALIIIITALVFYPLLPKLLNYPPNYLDLMREHYIDYSLQYLIVISICLLLSSLFYKIKLKGISRWESVLEEGPGDHTPAINEIREKCLKLPYTIYAGQILSCFLSLCILILIISIFLKGSLVTGIKLIIVISAFVTFSSEISFLLTKKILGEILIRTYSNQKLEGNKISINKKIFLQLLPMFTVSILLTALIGYSQVIEERGRFIFDTYRTKMVNYLGGSYYIPSEEYAWSRLKRVRFQDTKEYDFVISPQKQVTTSNGAVIDKTLMLYMDEYSHMYEGRLFDDGGLHNGVFLKVSSPKGLYTIGVIYSITSWKIIFAFASSFIFLSLFNIMVLFYLSKSLSDDISLVAGKLSEYASSGDFTARRKIPVTSNDEIGDLVVAFNKLQELELEYEKLKSDFFANISHELRTPLNIIFTTIPLLSRNMDANQSSDNTAKSLRYIRIMKQNCFRLLRLVNNLIDTTRIDAQFFNLHLKNCNIAGIVGDIARSVIDYTSSKKIHLEFNTEVEERVIACDPDAMERIMLNLLSNAIKFTGKGGRINVKLYEQSEKVIISVKDTGVGIEKDKQAIIFERFRQIDESLTRSHEGSGIGLSLVKSLVELHGGTIQVFSEYGKGSEFVITLPINVLPDADSPGQPTTVCDRATDGIDKINIEFSDIY